MKIIVALALLIVGCNSCKNASEAKNEAVDAVYQKLLSALKTNDSNGVAACLWQPKTNNVGYIVQRFTWILDKEFHDLPQHFRYKGNACVLYIADKQRSGYALNFTNVSARWYVTGEPVIVLSE